MPGLHGTPAAIAVARRVRVALMTDLAYWCEEREVDSSDYELRVLATARHFSEAAWWTEREAMQSWELIDELGTTEEEITGG
jgi:hypothetical protein